MIPICSLRKTVAALVALAALSLAAAPSAARADDFDGSGTAVATDRHGNVFSGTVSGSSTLGDFGGTFWHKSTDHQLNGVVVFDYGDGNTLTMAYHLDYVGSLDLFVGTYEITDGTGTLEGASGVGSLITGHGATVPFQFDGSISP